MAGMMPMQQQQQQGFPMVQVMQPNMQGMMGMNFGAQMPGAMPIQVCSVFDGLLKCLRQALTITNVDSRIVRCPKYLSPVFLGRDGNGHADSRDAVHGSASVHGHEGPGATVPCGHPEADGRGASVRLYIFPLPESCLHARTRL